MHLIHRWDQGRCIGEDRKYHRLTLTCKVCGKQTWCPDPTNPWPPRYGDVERMT